MDNKNLSFMEKSVFNYSSNFQDKKTIIELRKEIERLTAELEKLNTGDENESFKVIATVEDFSQLICERLLLQDKIKLVTALNQEIKKQQNTGIYQPDNSRNVDYIAKRIFKTRPSKKAALINTIKTMFQDEMTDDEIEKIIFDLQKRNFIKMTHDKVVY